jgi:hypothetical protein
MPNRFDEMLQAYARFETENQVYPIPPGYKQGRQLMTNMLREQSGSTILVLCLPQSC